MISYGLWLVFMFFVFFFFFFFNDTATTEIYTLSLHDALRSALALQVLSCQALVHGDWARADRTIGDGRARGGTDTQAGWLIDVWAGLLAARRGRSTEIASVCSTLAERGLRPTGRLAQAFHDVI